MLNSGKDLAAVLQALEISESTLERWRKQYGGMKSEAAVRLKKLEEENQRLKQLVADQALDIQMLGARRGGKLVSPSRRRAAVEELQRKFSASERRACKTVGQPRSSQRYQPTPRGDEPRLLQRLMHLVRRRPRFGYRRIAALLRADGFRASDSRVLRLWRREGLKAPRKKRKRRRLGVAANGCDRLRSTHVNHVWAWDVAFDRTSSGVQLKWLSIVDEYTHRMPGVQGGAEHHERGRDRHAGGALCDARHAGARPQRQWPRIHRPGDPALAGTTKHRRAVHRAGKSLAERLRGKLPQPAARRVLGDRGV